MEIRRFMRHLLSDSNPDHKIPGKQMARGLPLLKFRSAWLCVYAGKYLTTKNLVTPISSQYIVTPPLGACPGALGMLIGAKSQVIKQGYWKRIFSEITKSLICSFLSHQGHSNKIWTSKIQNGHKKYCTALRDLGDQPNPFLEGAASS